MKHVFIINSKSAKKKREHLQKEIKRVFAEKDYVIEWTQYKGHAKVLAVQYAKTADLIRIYACGGDDDSVPQFICICPLSRRKKEQEAFA